MLLGGVGAKILIGISVSQSEGSQSDLPAPGLGGHSSSIKGYMGTPGSRTVACDGEGISGAEVSVVLG